jgi:SAM-dependent methyltransferase
MKGKGMFRHRSTEPELMDDPALEASALELALSDIGRVNRLLGGNNVGLAGLKPFFDRKGEQPLEVVDLGCGNGEFLRHVARYCRRHNLPVRLTGVDINEKGLALGRLQEVEFPEITYECCDVMDYLPKPGMVQPLIICNLFLHHFSEHQIRFLLERWQGAGFRAIIVNDLHRSALAYSLFRLFGIIFMNSGLARHDGLVSIRRGFLRKELEAFSRLLPGWECSIRWKWAFRYLWTLTPPGNAYD